MNIKDANYRTSGGIFGVKSVTLYGFKYITVAAAPEADYLGDTVSLASKLSDDGRKSQLLIILMSVAVVVVMSLASVLFSWQFIIKPLHEMLVDTMKAIKFDFSMIKDGALGSHSIIAEVQRTKNNFLEMLMVFAAALKENKRITNTPSGVNTASDQKKSLHI
ncbi:hypothetical protein M427DRAFT_475022 [Gonapodya prolifera JEL478]|uniref:HAMP domain-containing protein n=1 Tax=Gonapodya prolifera (strain JEL478) TaxID=1344416 RepID=A0A139A167_GONPJ|nr:hypothetical protein M427DRAFT_475022 [Gonapodya prolifera JEL478]|eukprot:KXS10530.1 hypothetical protein M427DRAFT_475022 [Gonapodya prolifera JEL478]